MGISIEEFDGGCIRYHEDGGFGDPYEWSCSFERDGTTAILKGAVSFPWDRAKTLRQDIRNALRAKGYTKVRWERKGRGWKEWDLIMIDWQKAIRYARLVQIAESVRPDSPYRPGELDAIKLLGYTHFQTIYGVERAETVSYGFLATSNTTKELVVAIRGTADFTEWLEDADFVMGNSPIEGGIGQTEQGFSAVYKTLKASPWKNLVEAIQMLLTNGVAESVTICGHSLGAALATLLSLDLAITASHQAQTWLYASPRVGNEAFVAIYNDLVPDSFRVVNTDDPVPKVPAPVGALHYSHVNDLYELTPTPGKISLDPFYQHHLTTYLYLMGAEPLPFEFQPTYLKT